MRAVNAEEHVLRAFEHLDPLESVVGQRVGSGFRETLHEIVLADDVHRRFALVPEIDLNPFGHAVLVFGRRDQDGLLLHQFFGFLRQLLDSRHRCYLPFRCFYRILIV